EMAAHSQNAFGRDEQSRASQSEASKGPSPDQWTTAAAALAGFIALGFGFWFSAIPMLARQPVFFFGFVFLADAGLLALTVLGRALVQRTWQAMRFSNAQALPALVCYGLFLILFVAFPFCSAEKEKVWSWAISALAQALQFWLAYRVITLAFPNDWMGLLPAV